MRKKSPQVIWKVTARKSPSTVPSAIQAGIEVLKQDGTAADAAATAALAQTTTARTREFCSLST
jgi:gamma-glutamyltranspeptidase